MLLSIQQQAIEQKAIYQPNRTVQKGDVKKGFSESPLVMEGTIRTPGQEHYYMEPTSCIAVPSGEAGEMEIRSCFQDINSIQVGWLQAQWWKFASFDTKEIRVRSLRLPDWLKMFSASI